MNYAPHGTIIWNTNWRMVLKNNHNNKHYNPETETMFTIVYWMHLAVKVF